MEIHGSAREIADFVKELTKSTNENENADGRFLGTVDPLNDRRSNLR